MSNEKFLVINLNLFTKDNTIILISNEEDSGSNKMLGHYSIESLPEVINQLAEENEINTIKIVGNEKYAPLIEYGIKQMEMTKYNKNDLNIEVI